MNKILKKAIGFGVALAIILTANVVSAVTTGDGRNRITISGDITDNEDSQFTTAMTGLDDTIMNQEGLKIIINSSGGSADACMSIIYMIQDFKNTRGCTVKTYVLTKASSAGAIIFLMGDERYMSASARIMFHYAAFYDLQTKERMVRGSERGKQIPPYMWKQLDELNALMEDLLKSRTTLKMKCLTAEEHLTLGRALETGVATHQIKLQGEREYVKETNRSNGNGNGSNGGYSNR